MDYPQILQKIKLSMLHQFKLNVNDGVRVLIEDGSHLPELRGVYGGRVGNRTNPTTIRISIGIDQMLDSDFWVTKKTIAFYKNWISRALYDVRSESMTHLRCKTILSDATAHREELGRWISIAPTEPLWSQFYDQIQMILAQATLISAACGRR